MSGLCIGIDVGGTNTDGVVLWKREIVAKCKQPTTKDVTQGVQNVLSNLLCQISQRHKDIVVNRVNIGTTHLVNAVLQRKDLACVAVIRLCGPVSRALPPFSDLPDDLKQVLYGGYYFVDGGYEFDGKEIQKVKEEDIIEVIKQLRLSGIKNIVVSGIFSPICTDQEITVGEILKKHYPDASFTLSHKVANMGFLERENSSILNESLKVLGSKSIIALRKAVKGAGLKCPIFFTQNDGTILSAEQCIELPVLTFSSGPTNSMRGAAFLSNIKDAIVVDIGGTSTDVGVLVNGFPREASTRVKCGGVTTNFRLPDILCVALGGGSVVRTNENVQLTVGPDSVGYDLIRKSLVFGGSTLTTTDIAVAGNLCKIGDPSKVESIDKIQIDKALSIIHEMVENSVDQVKTKAENQPVILVGGGSVLIDVEKPILGGSVVMKPCHFEVANAVGAALSQVSGVVDQFVNLSEIPREQALQQLETLARTKAIENGARPESIVIVEKFDTRVSYLKGHASRIQMKVVGDLLLPETNETTEKVLPLRNDAELFSSDHLFPTDTVSSVKMTPEHSVENKDQPISKGFEKQRPFIEPSTGDWLVDEFDIECIAIGAGILGCGGGGSTYLGRVRALLALKDGKKIRIIHPENVAEKGLVLCVAYMGAPSVATERLPGHNEGRTAVEYVQKALVSDETNFELGESPHGTTYVKKWHTIPSLSQIPEDKKIVAIMSVEIGGLNSIEPLIVAADLGLPVVDCDGMGRAFPELQMIVFAIYGQPITPCGIFACNCEGKVVISGEPKALENHLRELVLTKMGCISSIAIACQTREQVNKTSVKFSLSRAWRLGFAVKMARKEKHSPIQTILDVENGKLIMSGKVTDVERSVEGGFNKGCIKLTGFGSYSGMLVHISFQNENLVAEEVNNIQKVLLATVPDLIILVDTETGEPIQTEDVRYGLRLSLIILPCSPLLTDERALKVVGPKAFGYDVEYKSSLVQQHCSSFTLPKSSTK